MAETAEATALIGRQIAITGRLASMPRPKAVALIEQLGGHYSPEVTPQTTLLVMGLEGWPLRRDGRLTKSLQAAQQLQREGESIRIISEAEFMGMVGLGERQDGVRRLFTTEQVCRILGVGRDEFRRWIRLGLVSPVKTVQRLCYFDFEQVSRAKAIASLKSKGVGIGQLRSSLQQLEQWHPQARNSLLQLDLIEDHGDLVLRLPSGQVADFNGQLRIDFTSRKVEGEYLSQVEALLAAEEEDDNVVSGTFEDWFAVAVRHEEDEDWEEAVRAYHRALMQDGPIAEVAFNMGNCLYALGRKEAASQRFMQAVENDPEFVEAWNNLGNVLSELTLVEDALDAFRSALRIDPGYADAHFNLGECLHQAGNLEAARRHWREYLKRDPHSTWARRVQRMLEKTDPKPEKEAD
jgi:tetratricopeptide (TPR) repeat protein